MMLPNESLLQVLYFVDYRTLVLSKLAGRRFLRLIARFAEELARHRLYLVYFYTTYIEYDDVTTGGGGSIQYELDNRSSLAAACRRLGEVLGTSPVAVLTFYGNSWSTAGVDVIFEAAPALKGAEDVALHSPRRSTIGRNSDAFMSNFVGMKSLRLWVDHDTFRQFKWKFLRQESARGLRRISASTAPSDRAKTATNRAVEELVRVCATLALPLGGATLELDFSDVCFSHSFGRRIIELLKDSVREVTFRATFRWSDNLIVNEGDYTVDGTTKRYTSKKSRIVVDVKRHLITIQSTAEVPPKNVAALRTKKRRQRCPS